MRYLNKFNESNIEVSIESIIDDVNDILLELSDIGFEVDVKYSYGASVGYTRKLKRRRRSQDIEIRVARDKEYDIDDIIEVYNRLCLYLESNKFEKKLVNRSVTNFNSYKPKPHLGVFFYHDNFDHLWCSTFAFTRWVD